MHVVHRVTFEEALRNHENQARKLGAKLVLFEQNHHQLRNKQAELQSWTRRKRHKFFLQSISRERRTLLCERLKLQSDMGLLKITLEKTRSDVQLLAKGGKIVRL